MAESSTRNSVLSDSTERSGPPAERSGPPEIHNQTEGSGLPEIYNQTGLPETDNQNKNMQRGRSSQNIADSPEEPLNHFKDDLKDVLFKATYASYKMPATAWGSFVLSLLIFKLDDWRSGAVIVYAVPQVLALCTSVIVQMILINFLASVEFDTLPDGQCNQEFWLGSITCGCMLGAAVFAGEARETMTMFQFLRCIPNYESDDDDLRRLPDFDADHNKDEEQGQSQEECLAKSKFALVVDVTDGIGRPRTGITRRLRGWLYAVLFVKLGLSAALMGFSFPLVMKSERASDIFLNCCATLFVLEVDDIIFKLMNSESAKQLFDSYPPLRPGQYARQRPHSKLRTNYPHVCMCSFWCSFIKGNWYEAFCGCLSCIWCCGCYLSDYLERFFWTCKNRCGENGNKNEVDVWFPIIFEAVLPFFGAMIGTLVLYQFQCVNYITPEQNPTLYWVRFYGGWLGWVLGFPLLSFFFAWSVSKLVRSCVYKDGELAPITGIFQEQEQRHAPRGTFRFIQEQEPRHRSTFRFITTTVLGKGKDTE